MRFTANNQYVHRMFRRIGNNSRHLNAIHRHLSGLDIDCHPPPCIGGIEVDLCGLYQTVQDLGGPKKVLENNLWPKVADLLKVSFSSACYHLLRIIFSSCSVAHFYHSFD